MGTPDFAVPCLKKLIDSKHEVLAVFTKEPKQANRGMKIQKTAIHELALENDLKVFTPKSLKTEFENIKSLNPDVIVVVAYGLILPKEILEFPKYGCINIHPSLLPRWRGAAPIQRAIMAGDKETGVCVMQITEGLDDGDVLACEKFPITKELNIQDLHDKSSAIGGVLILKVLENLNSISGEKQNDKLATYAKKIEKSECKITWSKTADEIDRQIRGLGFFLGTYFEYKGERIKILKAKICDEISKENSGTVLENFKIVCGDGKIIQPLILQREGKKKTQLKEFLKGWRLK